MRRIVFLDRDGTICEDSNYLADWRKMKIFDYSFEAVKIINEKGYDVYVITNQAGVAKGKFTLEEAENQKNYVLNFFNRDKILIKNYLYCPHHKDGIIKEFTLECNCRKPATGMIEKVLNIDEIDKKNTYVVGDKMIDIQLALNLGVNPALVLTGYGKEEALKIKEMGLYVSIYENILEFAKKLKGV